MVVWLEERVCDYVLIYYDAWYVTMFMEKEGFFYIATLGNWVCIALRDHLWNDATVQSDVVFKVGNIHAF